jgi:predicted phosphodiesterase
MIAALLTSRNLKLTSPDLITMTAERLLIFGGPYSNLAATRALLAEAARLGFCASEMLCTGDVIAYCGEPAQTLDLIADSGIQVVMGNCEESLSAKKDDCGCGFEAGTQCEVLSVQWFDFATKEINPDHRRWMAALPRQILVEIGGRKLLATHASTSSVNEFIFASSPSENKLDQMVEACVDGIISGHSGIPFAQMISNRLWLNAGAIGMPANDGTNRVWFAILEARHESIDIQIRCLSYDPRPSIKAMSERGLASGYRDCLSTGLWPSMDVLPLQEREQVGIALKETQQNWVPTKIAAKT